MKPQRKGLVKYTQPTPEEQAQAEEHGKAMLKRLCDVLGLVPGELIKDASLPRQIIGCWVEPVEPDLIVPARGQLEEFPTAPEKPA